MGYNANVTALLGDTSSDRILQHAQTLVAQLEADRSVCAFPQQSFFNALMLSFCWTCLLTDPHFGQTDPGCRRATHYVHLPLVGRNYRETGTRCYQGSQAS